jgi:hypothetical protein
MKLYSIKIIMQIFWCQQLLPGLAKFYVLGSVTNFSPPRNHPFLVASGTFLPATCNLPLAAVSSGEKLKTLPYFYPQMTQISPIRPYARLRKTAG